MRKVIGQYIVEYEYSDVDAATSFYNEAYPNQKYTLHSSDNGTFWTNDDNIPGILVIELSYGIYQVFVMEDN